MVSAKRRLEEVEYILALVGVNMLTRARYLLSPRRAGIQNDERIVSSFRNFERKDENNRCGRTCDPDR